MAKTAKPKAPTRKVVSTRLGPRSQRFTMPDGSTAIVCGPRPRIDTLQCGHEVITWGTTATHRRCEACAEDQGVLL